MGEATLWTKLGATNARTWDVQKESQGILRLVTIWPDAEDLWDFLGKFTIWVTVSFIWRTIIEEAWVVQEWVDWVPGSSHGGLSSDFQINADVMPICDCREV